MMRTNSHPAGRGRYYARYIAYYAKRNHTVLILGALCFAGGIFGEQFIGFLFSIPVSVDGAGYLQKIGFFVLSGIAGFFIHKYFVKRSPLIKRMREFDMSFRWICVSMGAFFAVALMVIRIF